jgi:predicted branched-subunit amino acid permease
MHRIGAVYAGVGDGPAGLLAAAGAILVCLFGFPHARWFLLASIVTGFVAAVAFRRWYQRKPVEIQRLSIK